MEQRDVSKQNVPALSYTATKNINDAAYVTEVLKMAFCWCCLPCFLCPLNIRCFLRPLNISFTSLWWQQQILCPAVRSLAGRREILSLAFQSCA